MSPKESKLDIPLLADDEHLSQSMRDFHFAMRCNGHFMLQNGNWTFNRDSSKLFTKEFQGQRAAFFGPNSNDAFFSSADMAFSRFATVFLQQPVLDAIRKYREIDEDQAARIAFLFGGIIRLLASRSKEDAIDSAVTFAARMTMLGEKRSADAIASAMAMYIISGGSLEENNQFAGNVYLMADAIRDDPIFVQETKDLGLSQVARLQAFESKIYAKEHQPFPDIEEYRTAFAGFPTVGAEFHFPQDAPVIHPNFWQRLAVLNMSQYQRGSYVQFCRNDRDVIEVRMNPSIYPIAIANWNHIRLLLPELNQTFFTVTLNRNWANFSWVDREDKSLLNNLRAIAMLSYAGMFENVPRTKNLEQINFGQVYLGQTVRIHDGKYDFSGNWGGGEGQHGQLAIYAGFGDTFPHLAYFLSVALARPDTFKYIDSKFLSKIKTLTYALGAKPDERRAVFRTIQDCVIADPELNKAFEAGRRIVELLSP